MVADVSMKPNIQRHISQSSSVGASKSRDAYFWAGVSAVVELHNHSYAQEDFLVPQNDSIDTAANEAQVFRTASLQLFFLLNTSQWWLLAG